MLKKMIEKTETYLAEALACNTILLTTMLNPSYRLSIFQAYFSSHHKYAEILLQQKFDEHKAELAATVSSRESTPQQPSQPQKTSHRRPIDDLNLFPGAVESENTDELANYLGGKYKVLPADADQCLVWWKVSILFGISEYCMSVKGSFLFCISLQEHHNEFPTLASLAKDYLACSATSASVERCFSAAADICGRDRGSLAPRTIEKSVSSHQWLKQGFKANGDFERAQVIVSQDLVDHHESRHEAATASK
ncbi:hypothetical protein PGT21_021847 [Puccinia graminis f. sp. tritici]|uniref:HAT C-terminal dimerisation domain-containing protein n=1 Tax=Puccinia graminis f. sp. tritici TaxID=56615 RepID=A0A5B0PBW9_PUCGR|nr:hypothetical protein PGT21_021847 [Puccinia graminis f. sp. tritici]